MQDAKTITDYFGNTPLIKLQNIVDGFSADIFVKLEYLNPGGSVKKQDGAADNYGC